MDGDEIIVRGYNLSSELIGKLGFTAMFLLDLDGVIPTPARVRVVDSILVALMEHGITPSTLAGRLVLDGAPEAAQGAVAAGLLATGSRFLGTSEEAARLLQGVVAAGTNLEEASRTAIRELIATDSRVPGLGHNLHKKTDPRVRALIGVAREEGQAGRHVEALGALESAAQSELGRPLLVNAAGAVGAILSDLGYRPEDVRSFALVARCAGLVAHIAEERREPMARSVWVGLQEHRDEN
jgi:citrate synthase